MKYGIFFEDEYNYLQHLKDTNEGYELEPVVDKFRLSSKVTEVGSDRSDCNYNVLINIKKRRCGMIANETTLHKRPK